MPTPLTSILLVTWNSGGYLLCCLDSLAAQTIRDFEVIIIDNGSTDGALENIENIWPGLTFKILTLGENKGYAVANNLGARLAQGKWLALLNTDAFPEPDWLENLLRAADNNPEYSFFASRLLQANAPDFLDGGGDCYHVSGLAWKEFLGYPASQFGLTTKEVFSPCAAAALYSRQAFLDAGGFDEDFFSYFEDVDLGFRLRLLGYRCLYVSDAIVHHVGSATFGKQSDFAFYHSHRNMVWTFVKNMPDRIIWKYLPVHILANIIYTIYYTLRGRGKVLWRAKWDAVWGLGNNLQKRKSIQARLKLNPSDLEKMMEKDLFQPYLLGFKLRRILTKMNSQR